jgi:hypothetical protein
LFSADGNRSGRIAGGTKRKRVHLSVLSDDVADADAEEAPAEVDAQQTALEPETKKAKKELAIDADVVFRGQRAKDSTLILFE